MLIQPFLVRLFFQPDLAFFTRRHAECVERTLVERTSVKDIIEGCGVPHTEVDLILLHEVPIGFEVTLETEANLRVFAVPALPDLHPASRLQRRHHTRFVADRQLGKLARRLRLLGLDVSYDREADDQQLVSIARTENCALLTRDRRLLMHAAVDTGYFVRSQEPQEQTREVFKRFELSDSVAPFTRCLRCNALLERATKSEIWAELEPLTKKYYNEFRRCRLCGQLYWPGSHYPKLAAQIESIQGGRD